ncbi:MAG: hypothetical protein IK152_07485 [Lachnospiraceae bacterium]|nr:hypothetical protein [Lachnospiraceae bacterium]
MRIDGSLLKDSLLKAQTVDNGLSTDVSASKDSVSASKASNIRPSHGFPRTNVEKSYSDSLSSLEEISQVAEAEMMAMTHQNLDYIARTVTPCDAGKAADNGFLPDNASPEGYVTVIDKIKIYMAMGSDDFQNYGETLDPGDVAKVTGSNPMAGRIAAKMAEVDVPVTEENVNEAMKAVAEGQKILPLSDGDKKYLISNDVLPTIENLYKAEHASLETDSTPISDQLWNEVRAQADGFIEEAGLPVNEETEAAARWLMANSIPIEADTLYAKEFYDNLKLPATVEELTDAATVSMNRGKKAMEGYILGDDLDCKYITSKRQLAEARVIMTYKAQKTMMDNGQTPDIEKLSRMVEDLEQTEREFYSRLMSAEGIEVTEDKLDRITETLDLTEKAKNVPEYVLGWKPLDMTLNQVVERGTELKGSLDHLAQKYETLMTRPRADMGDSINKAFRNIPDILQDLGLDVTAENAKAVRVLAYNRVSINVDNIVNMRNVDMAVSETLDALKPATVLHMIKESINPLNMTMEELRTTALSINEANDFEGSEKYSEFLWKLQNTGGISPEERDSYIGIYRMLRSIEKTDGAVVGALMEQGADLTIRNLMTAVRSRKKTGMNITIDDKTDVPTADRENINAFTMQAERAFTQEHPGEETRQEAERTFHQMAARKLTAEISPADMRDADADKPIMNQTLSQLMEQVAEAYRENPDKAREAEKMELRYQQFRMSRFVNACYAEDDVLRLLTDNDVPLNLYNIMAARDLMGRRSTRYDRMFKASDAPNMEAVKGQILEKLGESIKAPREMAEAMETLADVAENVMRGMINAEDANLLSVSNARLMQGQMALTMSLSRKEHYDIPVLIGDEVAGVSLKIVRGKRDKGKVDVVFDLGRSLGGKVAGEFIIKENSISGMIAAENREALDMLSGSRDHLAERLFGSSEKQPDLQFAQIPNLNIDRFMQGESITGESTEDEYEVQTRQLYGTAKQFLEYVKEVIK